MMADGFINTLSILNPKHFVGMREIEDKKELLASIKREDNFRDAFHQCGADMSKLFGFGIAASGYVQRCKLKSSQYVRISYPNIWHDWL